MPMSPQVRAYKYWGSHLGLSIVTTGTTVILSVKDSAGDSGVSSPFTIGQRRETHTVCHFAHRLISGAGTLGGLCSGDINGSSSVSDPHPTTLPIKTPTHSTSTADSSNPTDTETSTSSSGTSSPPQGGSQTTGDPSQKDGSDSSSVSPGQDSSPVVSPASDSLSSIPSSTSFTAQSAGSFNFK
jgi:hypothetical protein